jgi:hypothetical protein
MHVFAKNAGAAAELTEPESATLSTAAPGRRAAPEHVSLDAPAEERSDVARTLVVRLADGGQPTLDPVRAARIRERIRHGSYDRPDVVDAIARRALERGDL